MKTESDKTKLEVGDTVYYNLLRFEKDGWTVRRCEVQLLVISRRIANYLDKFGLRYVAHPPGKAGCAMAYAPDSLHLTPEACAEFMRSRLQARIDTLTQALHSLS